MKHQFIFKSSSVDDQRPIGVFEEEYKTFAALDIPVGLKPDIDADYLWYRGSMMWSQEQYPKDSRFVNSWKEYIATNCMSIYYPLIKDLTIPTIFVPNLDEYAKVLIQKQKWERVFIKNDIKSLWSIDEYASVWPNNSFEYMLEKFNIFPWRGLFAIRQFVEPQLFIHEERYWVINNQVFSRTGIVPPIVKEAAKRLAPLGSKYYVIDALPNLIVEINPGESSDRGGDNSAEMLAKWFREAM